MSLQFTKNKKRATSRRFFSYLQKSSEVGPHTTCTREVLQALYTDEFQGQQPIDTVPKFRDVFSVLKYDGLVQMVGNEFVLSETNPSQGKRTQKKTGAQQVASKQQGQSSSKRPAPRTRLAVDQHLSLPEMLEEITLPRERSSGEKLVSYDAGIFLCALCGVQATSYACMESHKQGKRHRRMILMTALARDRDHFIADKEDVRITSDYDEKEGEVNFDFAPNTSYNIKFTVHNDSKESSLRVRYYELLKQTRNVYKLRQPGPGARECVIQPGGSSEVVLECRSKYIGRFSAPLVFFLSRDSAPKIHFTRYVRGRCVSERVKELLPRSPYRPPPRVSAKAVSTQVVDGLRLPSRSGKDSLERKLELSSSFVPDQLRDALNRGLKITGHEPQKQLDYITQTNAELGRELSGDSHRGRFSLMLHMEEVQMEVDIRKYDMKDAMLEKCNTNRRLLMLAVPGLAENRPSVLRGDWLFVKREGDKKEYKGYVHEVEKEQVKLGFHQDLLALHIPNAKYRVRFVFNRYPMQMMHRALNLVADKLTDSVLFPDAGTVCKYDHVVPLSKQLKLYDAKLEANPEQFQAVKHILAGSSRPAPYIIFGPPGTGKTVTMVEAIKQIVRVLPSANVLACAPSNSAADLLTQRLLNHLDKREVLRLNASSRSYNTIPEAIRDCCNYDKNERDFFYPPKDKLKEYRVVTCTLITAGRLASADFPPGHFSHVFIDEAGYAMEPEALVALGNLLQPDVLPNQGGQVVLTGDPHQLGPVLRSPHSIKHGLGISLLERLMTLPVYKRHDDDEDEPYDRRLITKLVNNYRSHPAIIKLPNETFYNGELVAAANKIARESQCAWTGLPKRGFPIVMHGVSGNDTREDRSPSFFNPEEAVTVLEYITDLLDAKRNPVKAGDIGVITPYRRQVLKIKQLLETTDKKEKRSHKLSEVKVGSVEEFQGQERKVIIISTVRSNPEYLSADVTFKLGFLTNPKRYNVAVTRAKALLIVIGNPFILSKDEHWNSFLQYACDEGGYTGCDYENDDGDYDDILQKVQKLNLGDLVADHSAAEGGDVSDVTHQGEPQWRSEI